MQAFHGNPDLKQILLNADSVMGESQPEIIWDEMAEHYGVPVWLVALYQCIHRYTVSPVGTDWVAQMAELIPVGIDTNALFNTVQSERMQRNISIAKAIPIKPISVVISLTERAQAIWANNEIGWPATQSFTRTLRTMVDKNWSELPCIYTNSYELAATQLLSSAVEGLEVVDIAHDRSQFPPKESKYQQSAMFTARAYVAVKDLKNKGDLNQFYRNPWLAERKALIHALTQMEAA